MPDPAFVYTARTDDRACPVCCKRLDAATGVSLNPDDRHPILKIGDVTVCAYCKTLLALSTLGFRIATTDDLTGLDPRLRDLLFEFAQSFRWPGETDPDPS